MRNTTRQMGAATLFVVVILLFATTILVLFAARVGMQEQRISGNDFRAREAFSAAEDGLEQAKTYIKGNTEFFVYGDSLVTCAVPPASEILCSYTVSASVKGYIIPAGDLVLPLNSTSYSVGIQQVSSGILTVMSTGLSADGTGSATVQEQYLSSGVVTESPVPPVMAVGITAGGNFTAVGNPKTKPCEYTLNGDGTTYSCVDVACPAGDTCEQLFSTWSETTPSLSGSLQTCLPEGFKDDTSGSAAQCIGPGIADDKGAFPIWNQCACRVGADGDSYSTDSEMNEDIHVSPVPLSPNPFDDTFDYIFSLTRASMHGIATEIPNCDTLDAASTGMYWVTGDCDINGGEIGSRDAPVIVIVKGDMRFQGNAHAWGLFVGIDGVDEESPIACTDPTEIAIVGTFTAHGALVSDCDLDLGAGTFNAMYDANVFERFNDSDEFRALAPVAGTWRDF